MIHRKWDAISARLEDAFFPVGLCDLKYVYPREDDGELFAIGEDIDIPNHKAVVALDNRHVFTTVTNKYKLVTNEQAYQWAEPVMKTVFRHSNFSDFKCFHVAMTKTRSRCDIDLVREIEGGNMIQFNAFRKDDPWIAFIRIKNSYNRTSCLTYQLGFCRWICQNGMIFEDKSVDFVFTHTQDVISEKRIYEKLEQIAAEKIGEIRSLEEEFIAKLKKLADHPFPKESMLALACKVFDQKMTRDCWLKLENKQKEKAKSFVTTVNRLVEEYCDEFGPNAYAAMNVLTDFATYPTGISALYNMTTLQAKAGAWVNEFVAKSENENFKLTEYLGQEAMESALWFSCLSA